MAPEYYRRTYPFRRNRLAILYLCVHVAVVICAYIVLSYVLDTLPYAPAKAQLMHTARLLLHLLAIVLCIQMPLYLAILLALLLGRETIVASADRLHIEQHFVFFRLKKAIPRSQTLAIEVKPGKSLRKRLKKQRGMAAYLVAQMCLLAQCPAILHQGGAWGFGLGLKKDEKTELSVILQQMGYPLK